MPNKNAQIKFNAEYIRSLEVYITNCLTLYKKISPKLKNLHVRNMMQSVAVLQYIKDYAAFNGVQIPRKPYGPITHNANGHKFLNKGALAIKQLMAAAPAAHRGLGVKALDCVKVFENQLPG